jgi:DNA-binding transcriptional regulator YiaG
MVTFAEQLADSGLTAREVAAAVSPLLSVRTVEDWLQGRRTPPEWSHAFIFSRTRRRKTSNGKRTVEKWEAGELSPPPEAGAITRERVLARLAPRRIRDSE